MRTGEQILLGGFGAVVWGKRQQLLVHRLACEFGSLFSQLNMPRTNTKPLTHADFISDLGLVS